MNPSDLPRAPELGLGATIFAGCDQYAATVDQVIYTAAHAFIALRLDISLPLAPRPGKRTSYLYYRNPQGQIFWFRSRLDQLYDHTKPMVEVKPALFGRFALVYPDGWSAKLGRRDEYCSSTDGPLPPTPG